MKAKRRIRISLWELQRQCKYRKSSGIARSPCAVVRRSEPRKARYPRECDGNGLALRPGALTLDCDLVKGRTALTGSIPPCGPVLLRLDVERELVSRSV